MHSTELEAITGLTRYDLCRQFRILLGTSPHRYLLMRRLAFARDQIHQDRPLVEVACEAGFADQAHFTRVFKTAFGLTPARYRALRTGQRPSRAAPQIPCAPRGRAATMAAAMAGYRCPKCGKVAMVQKVCCGRPMKKA